MNAIAKSLALAAALSATPALAHEAAPLPPAPPAPYAQPVEPCAPPALPAPAFVDPSYGDPAGPVVRPADWGRGRELRRLQVEYWRLERERDRFYAGWRGNPWVQRRFESWYGSRRAELDRRYAWLSERHERREHEGRYAYGPERDDD